MTVWAYNPNLWRGLERRDIGLWQQGLVLINRNSMLQDRTEAVRWPVLCDLAPGLEIPEIPSETQTYEECLALRAQEIIEQSRRLSLPIRLLYSGGIDSTLALISLRQQLTEKEARQRIELVCSLESREENPWLWSRLILKEGLRLIPAEQIDSQLADSAIITGGEFNDQLWGSEVYRDLERWRGPEALSRRSRDDWLGEYLRERLAKPAAEAWRALTEMTLARSPVPLETLSDQWWWLNFAWKWSQVYWQPIMRRQGQIREWNPELYQQFYQTREFQIWSMTHPQERRPQSYHSWKAPARELIQRFQGPEYQAKIKRASLWRVMTARRCRTLITSDQEDHWQISPEQWLDPSSTLLTL